MLLVRVQPGELRDQERAVSPRLSGEPLPRIAHDQLVTAEDDELGQIELLHSQMPVVTAVQRGAEANVRVIDVIPSGTPERFTVLLLWLHFTARRLCPGCHPADTAVNRPPE